MRARESATFHSFTFSKSTPTVHSAYPLRVSKSASTGDAPHPRRATPRRWIRKRHGRHERRRVDRIARRGDERDPRPAPTPRRRGSRTRDRRLRQATRDAHESGPESGRREREPASLPSRRAVALAPVAAALLAPLVARPDPARADTECTECSNSNSSLAPGDKPFVQSPSGARFADLREGTGATPQPGQTVVVEWVGYTSGYQAKKIESTRETDAPYAFKLGAGEAIPAFEEAVSQMRVGGIRRIEIPGELEEKLAYSRDPSQRYAVGPVPQTLGGRRALDFVLDNRTLKDFNRTLLFDIRLSAIRK